MRLHLRSSIEGEHEQTVEASMMTAENVCGASTKTGFGAHPISERITRRSIAVHGCAARVTAKPALLCIRFKRISPAGTYEARQGRQTMQQKLRTNAKTLEDDQVGTEPHTPTVDGQNWREATCTLPGP